MADMKDLKNKYNKGELTFKELKGSNNAKDLSKIYDLTNDKESHDSQIFLAKKSEMPLNVRGSKTKMYTVGHEPNKIFITSGLKNVPPTSSNIPTGKRRAR